MDEGSGAVNMDAEVCFVPGEEEEFFFCNPVMLSLSGQMFAVPGDFMAVSAAMVPPGSDVGQTVRDERIHTENGRETTDVTVVSVRFRAVRKPLMIRLLQFSITHELLGSEEFSPGAVPDTVIPLPEADYLLLETVEEMPRGGAFTRREVFGRDTDYMITRSCREDGVCLSHYHEILWEADGPVWQ